MSDYEDDGTQTDYKDFFKVHPGVVTTFKDIFETENRLNIYVHGTVGYARVQLSGIPKRVNIDNLMTLIGTERLNEIKNGHYKYIRLISCYSGSSDASSGIESMACAFSKIFEGITIIGFKKEAHCRIAKYKSSEERRAGFFKVETQNGKLRNLPEVDEMYGLTYQKGKDYFMQQNNIKKESFDRRKSAFQSMQDFVAIHVNTVEPVKHRHEVWFLNGNKINESTRFSRFVSRYKNGECVIS